MRTSNSYWLNEEELGCSTAFQPLAATIQGRREESTSLQGWKPLASLFSLDMHSRAAGVARVSWLKDKHPMQSNPMQTQHVLIWNAKFMLIICLPRDLWRWNFPCRRDYSHLSKWKKYENVMGLSNSQLSAKSSNVGNQDLSMGEKNTTFVSIWFYFYALSPYPRHTSHPQMKICGGGGTRK